MTPVQRSTRVGGSATSTPQTAQILEQTANPAPPAPFLAMADQLLGDPLTDPATTITIRTNLRTWYLGAISDEQGWGGPESEQTRHYELLDELLALCALNALNKPSRYAPEPGSVDEFLADYFTDPVKVMEMRRNLRVWALVGFQIWEENIGTLLELQIEHYELLDELLTSLVLKAITLNQQPQA